MPVQSSLFWACLMGMLAAIGPGARAAGPPEELVAPGVEPQVLGTGYGFCEGPAADAQGNVYFSDGKNNTIHFHEIGQPVRVFVADSTDANGMMFNRKGELCVCEGAAYRIVAFDVGAKKKRILAPRTDGRQFNEPNDLSIDRQDGFYFTDPNYRHRGQETVIKEDTYYCSPEGNVARVSTVCKKPNGVLLTADDKFLYLADNQGRVIYRYEVQGPGKLAGETKWIDLGASPDGMTLDAQGNLYVACGKAGIKVYSPEAKHLGDIPVPYASNCCFGGRDFKTLFITSADKFLGLATKVVGMKPPCARE